MRPCPTQVPTVAATGPNAADLKIQLGGGATKAVWALLKVGNVKPDTRSLFRSTGVILSLKPLKLSRNVSLWLAVAFCFVSRRTFRCLSYPNSYLEVLKLSRDGNECETLLDGCHRRARRERPHVYRR